MAKRWATAETNYLIEHYPAKREPELAKILGRTELSIYNQLQRQGLIKSKKQTYRGRCLEPLKSKPIGIRSKYRYDITDTTCMQLCIGDFEGLTHKVLCELYSFNPRCLPRMLDDMKRSGAYHQYIEEFKVCNPACYDRAVKRQKRKRRVG